MPDADTPLARSRFIRDRGAELRRQFNAIEALFESGAITHAEELDRLRPVMAEVDALSKEMHRHAIAPSDVPDLQ